jgi:hypothetical protein
MNPDEATADALDAFAQQVLGACAPLDHMPTARLVLKAKEPGAWFVLYFFGSDDARSKAIKGGDAYVVYKTFLDNSAPRGVRASRVRGHGRQRGLMLGRDPRAGQPRRRGRGHARPHAAARALVARARARTPRSARRCRAA